MVWMAADGYGVLKNACTPDRWFPENFRWRMWLWESKYLGGHSLSFELKIVGERSEESWHSTETIRIKSIEDAADHIHSIAMHEDEEEIKIDIYIYIIFFF